MSQKIYYGIDSVSEILNGIGAKKLLLVCDSFFDKTELSSTVYAMPFETVSFCDFKPNPLYEDVCRGVSIFNSRNCDAILAIGGGSAIDVAKCIKLYCKMDPSENYLKQPYKDTGVPLIAVPTTAGTGSESTRHAVIYYNGVKQSISNASIVPDFAVLEPSVLKTLPVYQKKCTMLDALCQAIESWWSVLSTSESAEYSERAIKAILANYKKYIFENDLQAAKNIMQASNDAGHAINITATTAAHAMSYKLSSLYNIPHGHAVSLCMPHVWENIINNTDKCADSRGEAHLKAVMDDISELIPLSRFNELITELDMPSLNSDVKADLELITASVNPERLKNNPVTLSSDVIYSMYERIIK